MELERQISILLGQVDDLKRELEVSKLEIERLTKELAEHDASLMPPAKLTMTPKVTVTKAKTK